MLGVKDSVLGDASLTVCRGRVGQAENLCLPRHDSWAKGRPVSADFGAKDSPISCFYRCGVDLVLLLLCSAGLTQPSFADPGLSKEVGGW